MGEKWVGSAGIWRLGCDRISECRGWLLDVSFEKISQKRLNFSWIFSRVRFVKRLVKSNREAQKVQSVFTRQ